MREHRTLVVDEMLKRSALNTAAEKVAGLRTSGFDNVTACGEAVHAAVKETLHKPTAQPQQLAPSGPQQLAPYMPGHVAGLLPPNFTAAPILSPEQHCIQQLEQLLAIAQSGGFMAAPQGLLPSPQALSAPLVHPPLPPGLPQRRPRRWQASNCCA